MLQGQIIYLVKIGLALLLGGFIGYERESQHKSVGIRDVMLLCLASTLFTILAFEIPKYNTFNANYDVGRIIAYTIAGIGFLGSGVIIQAKGRIVEGITTATILFTVLSVGFFCGLGEYFLAIVSAIAIYVILKIKQVKLVIKKHKKRGNYVKRNNN